MNTRKCTQLNNLIRDFHLSSQFTIQKW